jgi:hypothetical protein
VQHVHLVTGGLSTVAGSPLVEVVFVTLAEVEPGLPERPLPSRRCLRAGPGTTETRTLVVSGPARADMGDFKIDPMPDDHRTAAVERSGHRRAAPLGSTGGWSYVRFVQAKSKGYR